MNPLKYEILKEENMSLDQIINKENKNEEKKKDMNEEGENDNEGCENNEEDDDDNEGDETEEYKIESWELKDWEIKDPQSIEKTVVPGETLSEDEKIYRNLLVSLIESKLSKSFDIEFFRVPNIHGLLFYGHVFSYCSISNLYYITLKTDRNADGIYANDAISMFYIRCEGFDIKGLISSLLDKMNRYIFCKHCGDIVNVKNYYIEQDKCINCIFTEAIMIKKKKEFCNICQTDTNTYYTLPCDHKFHRACISELKNKICPTCRENINTSSVLIANMLFNDII